MATAPQPTSLSTKDISTAFLTEMLVSISSDRRKAFIRDILLPASLFNSEILQIDLPKLINTEINLAIHAMERWIQSKIHLADRELAVKQREKTRKNEGFFGSEDLEEEINWYKNRIQDMMQIEENYRRKKTENDEKKRDLLMKIERLKGFLRFITRENMQIYPKFPIKPALKPQKNRNSATPEPLSTTKTLFFSKSTQRSVSSLKSNLTQIRRNLSTIRVKIREKNSISPVLLRYEKTENERFLSDLLLRFSGKSGKNEGKKRPVLRIRSSSTVRIRYEGSEKMHKNREELKCNRVKEVLRVLGENQEAQKLLLYMTFYSGRC